MKTYKVQRWVCGECGYKQDFEPTQENHNIHFNKDLKFPISNLVADQCPSCLKGVLKLEPPHKASGEHTILEESDVHDLMIVDGVEEDGKQKLRKPTKEEKEIMIAKIREDTRRLDV